MPVSQPRLSSSDPTRQQSPSHAERCRTIAATARTATFSTIAREPAGFPFGSLVTVAVDNRGRPLVLLSQLAEHTQNLGDCANASILLAEVTPPGTSPLSRGRVTLLGPCRPVSETERDAVSAIFLAAHPDAAQYAGFKDFAYYCLEPVALRYVGGFGRMSWVSAEEYLAAEPDPLAPHVEGILEHMNADHADAALNYARAFAGIMDAENAMMTAVDRYGFDLTATTPSGTKNARIAFDTPVRTTEEVRIAMVKLVKAARKTLEG
jgi:heme iron utilization protein